MLRLVCGTLAALVLTGALSAQPASGQQPVPYAAPFPYGAVPRAQVPDWQRFYHYPYVYYPQNFWGNEYYRSADSLYYRYPPEMRIPVYNKRWFNYYPEDRRYHWGHHFILDVF